MQKKFIDFRLDYAQEYFRRQLDKVCFELMGSKRRADQEMLLKYESIDTSLANTLLRHYISRCNLVHTLAFLQFRRLLPCADITELKETFEARKDYALRVLSKVNDYKAGLQEFPQLELEREKLKDGGKSELAGFDHLLMRVQLDCVTRVQEYAEVCMFDPFNEEASIVHAQEFIENAEFNEDIYPAGVIEPLINKIAESTGSYRHPRCIFLPSEKVVRSMLKALITFGKKDTTDQFLLRFGLLQNIG